MLTFDEATHTYTLDGIQLPSVTQLMDLLSGTSQLLHPLTLPSKEPAQLARGRVQPERSRGRQLPGDRGLCFDDGLGSYLQDRSIL